MSASTIVSGDHRPGRTHRTAMLEWTMRMLKEPKTLGARTLNLVLRDLPRDGASEARFEEYIHEMLSELKFVEGSLWMRWDDPEIWSMCIHRNWFRQE